MSNKQQIDIDPAVAYGEQAQEVAYLRNRNLVLAQHLAEAKVRLAELTAELETLRPSTATKGGAAGAEG